MVSLSTYIEWMVYSMAKVDKRVKDITGEQFGSLTALRYSHSKSNMAYWEYMCKCGKTHVARANTVTYQTKKKQDPELPSCGCVELARKTKHGYRKAKETHPTYKVYRSMMDRCYNPNSPGYQWYGAVGVTVCDEWKGNPVSFIEWALSSGWMPDLHIDKDILSEEKGIHPHVYSPETCQWVSAKENVGFATNRDNFGKHPNVRLSHAEVAELLETYFSGEVTNQSELARIFGLMSPSSVQRLIHLATKGAD